MRNNLCLLALCGSILFTSCSKDMNTRFDDATLHIPNRDRGFIIIAKEGVSTQHIAAELNELNVRRFVLKRSNEELGLIEVQTPDPSFPVKARQITGIESVVVDVVLNWRLPEKVHRVSKKQFEANKVSYRTNAAPPPVVNNNPLSFLQWGLNSIRAEQAWAKGFQGGGAKVAVLDGGFLLNDPEIMTNIILTYNFVDEEEIQYHGDEGFSHGTHVAGTIAALNDDVGVVGVAPQAKLILVKVLNDAGNGAFSALINGIYYAAVNGADVINMSLGGELPRRTYTDDNGTPDDASDDLTVNYDKDIKELVTAMNRAVKFANKKNATVIAAAGNDAYNYDFEKNFITYPAACKGVLAIAANGPLGWGINQDTSLYLPSIFTNSGRKFVAYGAPGGNYSNPLNTQIVQVGFVVNYEFVFDFIFNIGGVDEATNQLFYSWSAGTSMAAPHASGVAALLYGKYGRHASPQMIDHLFKKSSTDLGLRGKDGFFGDGQINAGKAVQ